MTWSTEHVDDVIDAIEELIEDMEFRRNPRGTWGGWENKDKVRERLREAIMKLIIGVTTPL